MDAPGGLTESRVNLGNSNKHCGPLYGSKEDSDTVDQTYTRNLHPGTEPMHLLRQRPSCYIRATVAPTIPQTQARAVDRRHMLDRQQRAFQVSQAIHPGVNSSITTRRRTPS
jgi:hypothetical protein